MFFNKEKKSEKTIIALDLIINNMGNEINNNVRYKDLMEYVKSKSICRDGNLIPVLINNLNEEFIIKLFASLSEYKIDTGLVKKEPTFAEVDLLSDITTLACKVSLLISSDEMDMVIRKVCKSVVFANTTDYINSMLLEEYETTSIAHRKENEKNLFDLIERNPKLLFIILLEFIIVNV